MKKIYFLLPLLLLAVGLFAQDPVANVQIIHNSPSPTVDIYANGDLLLDDFEFRSATPFLEIPAGVDLNIGVALANSTSVEDTLVNFVVQFEEDVNYVVTADGIVGDVDFPFTLSVNEGALTDSGAADEVAVAAHHGAPGAPNVDIAIRPTGFEISDLAYGGYTAYLSLAPATYYLDVKAAGSADIVATFEADLQGLGGGAVTVFASGFLDDEPGFGLYAALADGIVIELPTAEVSFVQIIHNSPSPVVDIYANGNLLVDDFEFRTATPFTGLPAGTPIDIGIALGNSTSVDDTLVNFNVQFMNGQNYVVTANGIVGDADYPFTLHVNDAAEIGSGSFENVAVAAHHGSPGAPNVDIGIRPPTGAEILDLAYGDYTLYLTLDTAVYYLDVSAAGSEDILATFEADLSALGGNAVTVFASGILNDDPAFGLFAALPDGTVVALPTASVARVQIIHNSPEPTVDIYANGELLLDDFEFRTATPYLTLPAGVPIDIGVALANSSSVEDTLVNFPVEFVNGMTYVAMASGVVGDENTPFMLAVNDMGREITDDGTGVDLLLYHGSTDAPEVDVVVEGGNILFDDVEYGEYQGYFNVPAADYQLNLTPAGDNSTIVQSYFVDLTGIEGLAATVFASGFFTEGEEPAFEVWAALPDGTAFALPTEPTSVNRLDEKLGLFQLTPNPAREQVQVQYELLERMNLNLRLFDANGRLLDAQDFGDQPSGAYNYQLNVSGLPAGIYHLSLSSKAGVSNRRLVIAR